MGKAVELTFVSCWTQRVTYEAKFPMEDDMYDSFRRPSGEGSIEFFELRVPPSMGEASDSYFLEGFFMGSFPELEGLRELRIVGYGGSCTQSKQRGRYEAHRQLGNGRVGRRVKNGFPGLRVLELRNLYVPLDTFDHLIAMFSLTKGSSLGSESQDEGEIEGRGRDGSSKVGRRVSACYNLRFEDGASRNHDYNISKYQGMSIQEESDFMLSSDYNSGGFGFSAPEDIGCGRSGGYRSGGFGDQRVLGRGGGGLSFVQSGSFSSGGCDSNEGCFGESRGNTHCNAQSLSFPLGQRDSPQVMQPFLEIRSWRISRLESSGGSLTEPERRLYSFESGVFVLDRQIREMRCQSLTEIHRNLISKTILEYLVDPFKTCVSLSDSRMILSLGFDNLVYSGYVLGVLVGCQRTIRELSALSFLIPIHLFCQLELDRIQVLRVSLFKDRDLEPADLIRLCTWVEKYRTRLACIHVRVTGASSKWVPNEAEIKRLVNVWKKMCPKAAEQDRVRFECCFTDQIFSKTDGSLSRDFGLETDSD